jgi:glycerate 2-kinase
MKVLVAPDSFKGTLSASEVAAALGRGLLNTGVHIDCCPVADGGEGTIAALRGAGHRHVVVPATDPLGRRVQAAFAVRGRTATVEVASASGLGLLGRRELDPWNASTYGTGQLIAAAAQFGVDVVAVAAGGSATVDGGRGAIAAIRDSGGLGKVRLVVLCDVRTTWERCATAYAPQKGASPEMVERLSARLQRLGDTLERDPRGVPGGGAAGGLAGGLWAAFGAQLVSGARYVLDTVGFRGRLEECVAVVCGEGRIDDQTHEGKVIFEIARRAHEVDVPVHAVAGQIGLDQSGIRRLGLASVSEARDLDELEKVGTALGMRLLTVT